MRRTHQKDVEPAAPEPESPGKVVVDSRGHSVWQWAKDVLENTSVLLKRLENKDLALESTQKVPVVPGAEPDDKSAGTKAASPATRTRKPRKTPPRSRANGTPR